jgi:ribulose-5-phosphate 4-epimerase/fuculose-1-phosphate aldolase
MGETIPEMFLKYYMLQRACEIQVKTCSLGKPIRVPPEVVEVHQHDRDKMLAAGFGVLDFEAWKRKIDTIDKSWRE